jgi:hypothetical protein
LDSLEVVYNDENVVHPLNRHILRSIGVVERATVDPDRSQPEPRSELIQDARSKLV